MLKETSMISSFVAGRLVNSNFKRPVGEMLPGGTLPVEDDFAPISDDSESVAPFSVDPEFLVVVPADASASASALSAASAPPTGFFPSLTISNFGRSLVFDARTGSAFWALSTLSCGVTSSCALFLKISAITGSSSEISISIMFLMISFSSTVP